MGFPPKAERQMSQARPGAVLFAGGALLGLAIACSQTSSSYPSPLTGRWSGGIDELAYVDPARGLDQPYGSFLELRPDGGFFSQLIFTDSGYLPETELGEVSFVFAVTVEGSYSEPDAGLLLVTGAQSGRTWAERDGGLVPIGTGDSTASSLEYWGVAPDAAPPLLFLQPVGTAPLPLSGTVFTRLDPPNALAPLGRLPSSVLGRWVGTWQDGYSFGSSALELSANGQLYATGNQYATLHQSTLTFSESASFVLTGQSSGAYPAPTTLWLPSANLSTTYMTMTCEGYCEQTSDAGESTGVQALLHLVLSPDGSELVVVSFGGPGPLRTVLVRDY